MDDNEVYETLRYFTSPVVAITSAHDNAQNGMIANSALRVSLLPEVPRIIFNCFRTHYSHSLINQSGWFCLHLLHSNQLDTVKALGFESGRDSNILANLSYETSERNIPILKDALAYFECKVLNRMDAGPSTLFLGESQVHERHSNFHELEPLGSDQLRNQLSDEYLRKYRENKQEIQEFARNNVDISKQETH